MDELTFLATAYLICDYVNWFLLNTLPLEMKLYMHIY